MIDRISVGVGTGKFSVIAKTGKELQSPDKRDEGPEQSQVPESASSSSQTDIDGQVRSSERESASQDRYDARSAGFSTILPEQKEYVEDGFQNRTSSRIALVAASSRESMVIEFRNGHCSLLYPNHRFCS